MKYNFFYGTQMVEFERPEVPPSVVKKGINYRIKVNTNTMKVKSWRAKVVVQNVCD